MASADALFMTIPGLEGLIAQPSAAALPPPPAPAAAPSPPSSAPGGSPVTGGQTPTPVAPRGVSSRGAQVEGTPGDASRVGGATIPPPSLDVDAAVGTLHKAKAEDGAAVAVSLFSEDDDSAMMLRRRVAMLAAGMQVRQCT